jgi:hypothetical protein
MKDQKLKMRNPSLPWVESVVYYESINRELKTRPIYECRCDERLKTKVEESSRLIDRCVYWHSNI